LARSWRLTVGSFWRLSIIYTVALIVLVALYAVSGAVAAVLAAVFAHGDVAMVTAFTQVIGIILGAVATPFYAALALAVLADLKVRKEGADLAQRISATA
jgi:maltodextrin utilization protein YvdJ